MVRKVVGGATVKKATGVRIVLGMGAVTIGATL
jgi:hypothetical protein